MKKELTIKTLHDDSQLESLILMHKRIFLDTPLQEKLIYFDESFREYFRKVLSCSDHYVFGVFSDSEINGFLHFRKYGSSLFLNNIFLNEKIRGKGTGTAVLNFILNMPFIIKEGFNFLELDVLESNVIAKKWYNKIGLVEIFRDIWYDVESNNCNNDLNLNFKIDVDQNNFKSLIYNDTKVATIISDFNMVVHDTIAFQYTGMKSKIYKTRNLLQSEKSCFKFSEIDSSIRMRAKISHITNLL